MIIIHCCQNPTEQTLVSPITTIPTMTITPTKTKQTQLEFDATQGSALAQPSFCVTCYFTCRATCRLTGRAMCPVECPVMCYGTLWVIWCATCHVKCHVKPELFKRKMTSKEDNFKRRQPENGKLRKLLHKFLLVSFPTSYSPLQV